MSKLAYIVEDEENIRELIGAALGSAGFATQTFENAQEFYNQLEKQLPSIVLLDIMLPEESGLEILKKLRKRTEYADLPVIFLTAKSSELDKVIGLELGADDYIVKPFGVLELLARVNAVLRRYTKEEPEQPPERVLYKDLELDELGKRIYKAGETVPLTYKEYELFLCLYKNRGIVLSREQLLEQVWHYEFEGETRTVDSHIRSLRSKLGDSKDDPKYIVTTRGYGYRMIKE